MCDKGYSFVIRLTVLVLFYFLQKSDMMHGSRRMLHEGIIGWKNARGKTVDVHAVLLTDVLFFIQENNQKYSFFSQDNKVRRT